MTCKKLVRVNPLIQKSALWLLRWRGSAHQTPIMDVDSTGNSMDLDTEILPSSTHSSLSDTVRPYTDDDHRRMDEAVNDTLHHLYGLEGRECLSFGEIILTLQEVILQDDRLDPKNQENHVSRQLFDKYPWLRSKIGDAWTTGSYRDIRALGTHVNHE
jgi:hypothetical protein